MAMWMILVNMEVMPYWAVKNGLPIYELTQWPEHHECCPPPEHYLAKEFAKDLYNQVKADPLKSIPTIYEESLLKMTEKLKFEQKEALLSEIPTFQNMKSQLYNHRQKFIPKVPQEFVSIISKHAFLFFTPHEMCMKVIKITNVNFEQK